MIHVAVRAHPGARFEKVLLSPDGKLEVWVRAPALDGRANTALVELLASALGLRPRQLQLVRGQRSREKLLAVDLPSLAALGVRLSGPGGTRETPSDA